MNNRRLALTCGLAGVIALGTAGLLLAQDAPKLTDTQKVIMENAVVRVIDVRVPAGVAEPLHSHARGVTVALTEYDNETRARGGQWSKSHTRAGEVKWADPVTHEARNVGTTEQHVIRIELK
jgi:hypothetical protein